MDIKNNIARLFGFVRTIFENDINVKKTLSSDYEANITKRLLDLPKEYRAKMNKILVLFIAMVESIDFERFAEELGQLTFNISSYDMFQGLVVSNTTKLERGFAMNLLEQMRPLLVCLDLVVANPRRYAAGVAAINKCKDILQ